jgi:formylglycine-generating enzyme required for sulfatase activity
LFEFRAFSGATSIERRYLRWSAARGLVQVGVILAAIVIIGESIHWATERGLPLQAVVDRWSYKLVKQLPLPHLIEIRSGSFEMGSSGSQANEWPPHHVTFAQPFELGATEVTFREWDACVVDSACKGELLADSGWGRDMQPVINVSWEDAKAYAEWLGRKTGRICRLPSEAEWEYACRAGTKTEYALPSPDGSDDITGKGLANCEECGSKWDDTRTAPVASFDPNAWGLHDMHGNVWEWVEDCWHYGYEDAPGEGQSWLEQNGGICDYRVLRGGSWSYAQVGARCAFRVGALASGRGADIGFRVVCSPPIMEPEPTSKTAAPAAVELEPSGPKLEPSAPTSERAE